MIISTKPDPSFGRDARIVGVEMPWWLSRDLIECGPVGRRCAAAALVGGASGSLWKRGGHASNPSLTVRFVDLWRRQQRRRRRERFAAQHQADVDAWTT